MQRFLRRWEALPVAAQTVAALVAGCIFMLLLHLGPLQQPVGRAVGYSIFWGVLMGGGIMIATRAEAARRRKGDGDPDDDDS